MDPFTNIQLPLPLHSIILLMFYLITGLYTVFTIIMYYHWNEYSTDSTMSRVTLFLYLGTTVPLLLALGGLTFFIS
jgi:hypothetical protein